jgi:hypothetical protein
MKVGLTYNIVDELFTLDKPENAAANMELVLRRGATLKPGAQFSVMLKSGAVINCFVDVQRLHRLAADNGAATSGARRGEADTASPANPAEQLTNLFAIER